MKDISLEEYQAFAHKGILPAGKGKNLTVGFALGLGGESGEVIDDIKKREYHGRDISIEHTAEELGDVMWYVANLATELGYDLQTILNNNVIKLKKRYPEMYGSDENARKQEY